MNPPVRAPSRAARKAETRQRLIDVAVTLFSDNTFDDVVAADIAKAAGVAHGLLFHYFGSKRGIYLEAMHEAATQLDAAFVLDPELPPESQIRAALRGHLHYLAEHQGLALRLVLGGRGADPQAWEVFEAARMRTLQSTLSAFGLDTSNTALLMMGRAAIAALDEATVRWLRDEQQFTLDAMVDSMIVMLASGLDAAATLDPTLDLRPLRAVLPRDAGAATRSQGAHPSPLPKRTRRRHS